MTYFLIEERGFLGRSQFSKYDGEPPTKSLSSPPRKIIRKQEITRDEFLTIPLNELIAQYWQKEEPSNAD